MSVLRGWINICLTHNLNAIYVHSKSVHVQTFTLWDYVLIFETKAYENNSNEIYYVNDTISGKIWSERFVWSNNSVISDANIEFNLINSDLNRFFFFFSFLLLKSFQWKTLIVFLFWTFDTEELCKKMQVSWWKFEFRMLPFVLWFIRPIVESVKILCMKIRGIQLFPIFMDLINWSYLLLCCSFFSLLVRNHAQTKINKLQPHYCSKWVVTERKLIFFCTSSLISSLYTFYKV